MAYQQQQPQLAYQQPAPKPQEIYEENPAAADGVVECLAVTCSMILFIITLPFSLFFCFKIANEFERLVLFRLGRIRTGGPRGPGLVFVLPCIDAFMRIDLRTESFDVPCQEVLSKDCVTVAVDAVVFFRVVNPLGVALNISDYSSSTRDLAATTLRNVMGTCNLSDILTQREVLAKNIQVTLDEATERWGVQVERVEIKDVRLPIQLQRAMRAEAEAAREPRGKVIATEGELKASKNLKDTAKMISENPAAMQLHYGQTLGSMASDTKSTIIFPQPSTSTTSRPQVPLRPTPSPPSSSRNHPAPLLPDPRLHGVRHLVHRHLSAAIHLRYFQTLTLGSIASDTKSTI